ncbi:MAG: hypothetical protein JWO86_363 [Myxococcaceae bacterium]|nr:hypothetical protein [Myxococcaceae bacterium]
MESAGRRRSILRRRARVAAMLCGMANDKEAMDALREHLERYCELGERHLFRFRDGRSFDGWVVEVGEEDLLVTPEGADEEVTVPIAEIDPASLVYVDASGTRIPFAPPPAPSPSTQH